MASEAGICNLALLRIGVKDTIGSLLEASQESQACAVLYPHCRDVLLASFAWPFATRRADLIAVTGGERDGWTYAYALPSDCLSVQYIYTGTRNPISSSRYAFSAEMGSGGTNRVLYSDAEAPQVAYTAKVILPGLFSPLFTDALAWLLAKELVMPLSARPDLAQAAMQQYALSYSRATAQALNEGHELEADSELISVRS